MNRDNLLKYVEDNATNVDDLVKVHTIRTAEGSTLSMTLLRELREKYEPLAEEDEKTSFWNKIFK